MMDTMESELILYTIFAKLGHQRISQFIQFGTKRMSLWPKITKLSKLDTRNHMV